MTRRLLIIACVFLFLIVVRFQKYYQRTSNYSNGQVVQFETTILNQPYIKGNIQYFSVSPLGFENISIITLSETTYLYGETVHIAGKVTKRVLDNKQTTTTIYFPKIEAVFYKDNSFVGRFLATTNHVRKSVEAVYTQALPYPSSHLLLALVFGRQKSLPPTLKTNLRNSGVLHIVVASGMNVAMVAGFVSSVALLFVRRQLGLLIATVGVCLYIVLVGFDPPIVRASLMGILSLAAGLIGRQYVASYGLLVAIYLMLFISPGLIEDIGFQLSCMATAGLIYVKPFLDTLLNSKMRLVNILAEGFNTTLAAQIATLPLLLVYFGTYSLLSIVTNVLILWTIPLLMVIGGVSAMIGLVVPFIGQSAGGGIAILGYPLLVYIQELVGLMGKFEGLKIPTLPLAFTIGYYCLLISFILLVNRKR